MEEKALIQLYFDRSEKALDVTKQTYGRLIRTILRRFLPLEHDVEECENDTYLAIWQNIPPQNPQSLKAYIAGIARNLAYNRYRYLHAEKRDAAITVSFDELAECLCDRTDDGIHRTDDELRETMHAFLDSLKPEARRMFLLRYWEGCSIQEIMQQCHCSKSKAESLLFRTRGKLKAFLQERGYME